MNPTGILFWDIATNKQKKYVTEGSWKGWIVFKHPDGQWVSDRPAKKEDLETLLQHIAKHLTCLLPLSILEGK